MDEKIDVSEKIIALSRYRILKYRKLSICEAQ